MVNKFKTATKRIVAIAASAALVSSTAFAGGLSNYPNNFVKNNTFNGQVIVGANAAAIDTTSAQSVIDNLKSDFSGAADKVVVTATKSSGVGQSIKIDDSGKTFNYGEKFGDVKSSIFDNSDLKILADGSFNNGADNQDYTQVIKLNPNNGYFEHSLRNNFESTISDHLYLTNADVANYTLEFKTPVNFGTGASADMNKNFVGKTLNIMGQDFTVTNVGSNFNSMELIGGANQVTIGEGDAPTTVTVNGKSYEVSVVSVSSGTPNKVLISVNGQTKSIDEFNTETISGVTIGVTDAFPSSRNSVKGYTTLVIGLLLI